MLDVGVLVGMYLSCVGVYEISPEIPNPKLLYKQVTLKFKELPVWRPLQITVGILFLISLHSSAKLGWSPIWISLGTAYFSVTVYVSYSETNQRVTYGVLRL